jgi:hypothetical protein
MLQKCMVSDIHQNLLFLWDTRLRDRILRIGNCLKFDRKLDDARVAFQIYLGWEFHDVRCSICGLNLRTEHSVNLCLTCLECWLCERCVLSCKGQGQAIESKNFCRGHDFMEIRPLQANHNFKIPTSRRQRVRKDLQNWADRIFKKACEEIREISPAYHEFLRELRQQGVNENEHPYHQYIFFADDDVQEDVQQEPSW